MATVHDQLILGQASRATGAYQLSAGVLEAGSGTIGLQGIGRFTQTGGRAVMDDQLILGQASRATGVYHLSGGVLEAGGGTIGLQGIGRFTQTGGRADFGGTLTLGGPGRVALDPATGLFLPSGTGTYDLSGGVVSASTVLVGRYGSGQFTQTGGLAHILDRLYVGNPLRPPIDPRTGLILSGRGMYHLAGGTLQVDGYESIVEGSSFFQTAGLNRVLSGGDPNTYAGTLSVGGTYVLEGGCLDVEVAETIGGGHAASLMIQSGGVNRTGTLGIGAWRHTIGRGTYELSGGCLETGDCTIGTGLLDQSGGTAICHGALRVGDRHGLPSDSHLHLSAGSLSVASGTIGYEGYGLFTQTGGQAGFGRLEIVQESGPPGLYAMRDGKLDAGVLEVRGGTLELGRHAEVSVSTRLDFADGHDVGPVFSAERGASIRMTGPRTAVGNSSTDPSAMAGLSNLRLVFAGPRGAVGELEVAGKDLGPVPAGFESNFALAALEVGAESTHNLLRLLDESDNQPAWTGDEALYVDRLILRKGAKVATGGLGLYYRNGGGKVKRFFRGDANLDGSVDAGDLALFGANWMARGGDACWADGDFTGDGYVDGGDLALLGGDWGCNTDDFAPPPAQPIPEPATLAMLAGLAGITIARRRKSLVVPPRQVVPRLCVARGLRRERDAEARCL